MKSQLTVILLMMSQFVASAHPGHPGHEAWPVGTVALTAAGGLALIAVCLLVSRVMKRKAQAQSKLQVTEAS